MKDIMKPWQVAISIIWFIVVSVALLRAWSKQSLREYDYEYGTVGGVVREPPDLPADWSAPKRKPAAQKRHPWSP